MPDKMGINKVTVLFQGLSNTSTIDTLPGVFFAGKPREII